MREALTRLSRESICAPHAARRPDRLRTAVAFLAWLCLLAGAAPARALTIVPVFHDVPDNQKDVMAAAFATWARIIHDPLTLTLDIGWTSLPTSTLARSTGFTAGADGRPESARIDINERIDWFVDPTADLAEEFEPTRDPSRFMALPGSDADGRFDLFTVFVHELTHTLGFAAAFPLFADHLGLDRDGRREYSSPAVTATLAAGSGTHTADDIYPYDLMNPFIFPGERRLPSYIDALILADAFGYDVDLPEEPPVVAPVPEPASWLLVAFAMIAGWRRFARRQPV